MLWKKQRKSERLLSFSWRRESIVPCNLELNLFLVARPSPGNVSKSEKWRLQSGLIPTSEDGKRLKLSAKSDFGDYLVNQALGPLLERELGRGSSPGGERIYSDSLNRTNILFKGFRFSSPQSTNGVSHCGVKRLRCKGLVEATIL
jgi:hypothetical protein